MRVGHQPGHNAEVGSKKTARGAGAGDAKRIEKESGTDVEQAIAKTANKDVKAEISNKSKEFAHAKAVAHNAPDVRADKIAELKRKIADKSYAVDSAAVADKLVDEHLRTPEKD